MKAAVLHQAGAPLRVEEVALEAPRAGEVLLRVAASGVCRSDHHVMTGATPHPMPVVCGHEGAGVVEQVGPGVTRVAPGDHVVLSWAPSCGACFFCRANLPAQCQIFLASIWAGTMLDGTTRLHLAAGDGTGASIYHFSALATFAEKTVVPESCCVAVRRDVPLDVAALVGCCVATGFCAARVRAKVEPGARVAVFGCGGVGLNIIQGAVLGGASRVIAADVSAAKLEAARLFGATDTIDASRADPVAAVREMTDGLGSDFTFEAIGSPRVMQQAIEAARRGGTIVLVGLGPRSETISLGAGDFTRSDKVLTSGYYGGCNPQRDFPAILDLYVAGRLKLEELITRRRPLDQINEAFADMVSGETIRTVITF